MGRELQKKKRRSGHHAIRQSNVSKKILNPKGNTIIAQNWNKKETMAQNYRRLGLMARLKAPTGGTEKLLHAKTLRTSPKDPFAITTLDKNIFSEAKVERDADGKITRILGRTTRDNPLNDPLVGLDGDSDAEDNAGPEWGGIADDGNETTDVVKSLLQESRMPEAKKPRHQSERERDWLELLIAKHGDDTAAMAQDRRLNRMQQTAADIARRIRLMKGTAA
ncbi:hypothetical protein G7046_g3179 [Stylonectria norvegica]|nr:hypothetical protein G7046_g3179 [Stylonectria norvegica]